MKKHCLLGLLILFSIVVQAQNKDTTAILQILKEQEFYWNKGDLDNFVKGYWQNDSLMFIGSKGVVYGYNNMLQRYKTSYDSKEKMGILHFTILHLNKLCDDQYFLVGKFDLKRAAGDLSGHFNLLLKKINGEWKIISDHSS